MFHECLYALLHDIAEMKLSRIPNNCSPEGVNNILLDKWGIRLFRFAQVFAVSPVDSVLMKSDYPISSQEIRAVRRSLKKMGKDLLKRGRFILNIMNKLWESPKESSDDELIKHMRLEEFFTHYVHRHRVGLIYLEKVTFQGRRGSRINRKSIIALGWGNMISERGHRIDWRMLGSLYDWLWEKVAPYGFYKELEPTSCLEEDLRHQYNRHRWPGGAANFIYGKLGIKEEEILEFVNNFLLNQIFGDKEDYFEGKISPREFPKLFMNFFVDSFGSQESLTLFSKDQSLVDALFLLFYFRLTKMVGEGLFPCLKGKVPEGLISLEGGDWPYRGTEIDDYFVRAINLYIDNNVDLANPTPLIVFPDKSYFSSSF